MRNKTSGLISKVPTNNSSDVSPQNYRRGLSMTLSENKLWIVRGHGRDGVIKQAESNHSKCAVSKGGSTAAFVPPVFILS